MVGDVEVYAGKVKEWRDLRKNMRPADIESLRWIFTIGSLADIFQMAWPILVRFPNSFPQVVRGI